MARSKVGIYSGYAGLHLARIPVVLNAVDVRRRSGKMAQREWNKVRWDEESTQRHFHMKIG